MNRIHSTRAYEFVIALALRQVGLLVVLLSNILAPRVYAAIIDTDFTIDAVHSFPSEGVIITDGIGGPAGVTMLPGGTMRGFTVAGNSTFEMTGGTSTMLSDTRDNATLIMRGGTIECSAPVCLLIDYVSLLSIEDNSSLHIFGGTISGSIQLRGNGAVNVYGKNLTLTIGPGGAIVEGVLAGGEPIGNFGVFSLDPHLSLSNHIFIHEIPEPSTAILVDASLAGVALLCARNRRIWL